MTTMTHYRLTFTAVDPFIIQVLLIISRTPRGHTYTVASCGSKIPGSEIPLCHCDAACRVFHDCCYGYTDNDTVISQEVMSQMEDLKTISTCIKLPGQSHQFTMVTPSIAASVKYRKFITACNKPGRLEEVIPSYDPELQLHFGNIYCLGLYEQEYGSFKSIQNSRRVPSFWTVELNYDCYSALINGSSYSRILKQLLINKVCTFTVVPPSNSSPRICFNQDVERCPMKEMCLSYQSPVVNSVGEILRNTHCAACLNPQVHYTDLAVARTQHVKETILTMTPLHEWTNISDCIPDGQEVCPEHCGIYIGLTILTGGCIKPVSKARGRLHGFEVQIGSRSYMDPDGKKTRLILSRYVNITGDMYVKGTPKYTIATCWNSVQISIYTIENMDYEKFLNMASILKDGLAAHTDNIDADLMNSTSPVSQHCVVVNPSTMGVPGVISSPFDNVQMIIFVLIFVGIVLLISCIILSQILINRLRRAQETIDE